MNISLSFQTLKATRDFLQILRDTYNPHACDAEETYQALDDLIAIYAHALETQPQPVYCEECGEIITGSAVYDGMCRECFFQDSPLCDEGEKDMPDLDLLDEDEYPNPYSGTYSEE